MAERNENKGNTDQAGRSGNQGMQDDRSRGEHSGNTGAKRGDDQDQKNPRGEHERDQQDGNRPGGDPSRTQGKQDQQRPSGNQDR